MTTEVLKSITEQSIERDQQFLEVQKLIAQQYVFGRFPVTGLGALGIGTGLFIAILVLVFK